MRLIIFEYNQNHPPPKLPFWSTCEEKQTCTCRPARSSPSRAELWSTTTFFAFSLIPSRATTLRQSFLRLPFNYPQPLHSQGSRSATPPHSHHLCRPHLAAGHLSGTPTSIISPASFWTMQLSSSMGMATMETERKASRMAAEGLEKVSNRRV